MALPSLPLLPLQSLLRRHLRLFLLLLLLLAALSLLMLDRVPKAQAQRLTMPDVPALSPNGFTDQYTQAQLAVSDWSPEELRAWWAGLRGINGASDTLPEQLQPPQDADWRPVSLPDVRPRQAGVRLDDDQRVQMRWYRLRYAPPHSPLPASLALYMPRLVSMAAAVLMRVECSQGEARQRPFPAGAKAARDGPELPCDTGWRLVYDNQAGAREQWVRPLFAVFPGELPGTGRSAAGPRVVELVVAVPVLRHSFYTVSSVWLGPREALEPRAQGRWALQIDVPKAGSLLLLVLGLFAFTLWRQRRSEPLYLLFALTAAAWLLRNLHYHIDLPDTRAGLDWFWWLTNASLAWVMLLTFLFALRFARQRYPRFERLMEMFVVLSTVLTMPLFMRFFDPLLLQHLVNAVVGLAGTALVLRLALREGGAELRLIAACLVLALGFGIHDLGLLAGWGWSEHVYLLPFATLVLVAGFLFAVQRRFLGALGQVEQANEQQALRLAEQGVQLREQHQRLSEAERQQALLMERQRLMQDMHDGLGSSLLSAMVAVEQGAMSEQQVVEVLRECVDDLRLVIDSLEPVGHDLVSLLATMRYRLGKRLQAGGLVLEWDVHDLPTLDWLDPPDALHVLRLLQEALNNVIKHAGATRVRIATRDLGGKVEIRVEDDGQGFDVEAARRGRGLRSQLKRAQRLGGSLQLQSTPGHGTQLCLRLPVKRRAPDQPETPPRQDPG